MPLPPHQERLQFNKLIVLENLVKATAFLYTFCFVFALILIHIQVMLRNIAWIWGELCQGNFFFFSILLVPLFKQNSLSFHFFFGWEDEVTVFKHKYDELQKGQLTVYDSLESPSKRNSWKDTRSIILQLWENFSRFAYSKVFFLSWAWT